MSKVLNDVQQSLELLWAERHQHPKHMAVVSRAILRQAKQQADSLSIGFAYRNLGYVDLIDGNLEVAWDSLNSALEVGRRHDMPSLVADASNCLAGVYRGLGNTASALTFLENALRICEELKIVEQFVPLKMNIGILLQDLGRQNEALSYFEGVLEVLKDFPHQTRQLEVKSNYAMTLLALGKSQEAQELLLELLQTSRALQLRPHEVRNLVNLGEVHTKLEHYSEALEVLRQALQLIETGIVPEGKTYCLLNIAKVQNELLDHKSALFSLEQAKISAEELGIIPIQAQIAHAQYEIYKQQNQAQEALGAFETYHRIHEQQRQHNAERELRLFALERDFEKTVAEAEINRLKNVELVKLLERVQEADQIKAALLEDLGAKTNQLEVLVKQDPLTGVHNRRYLEQALKIEFQKAKFGQYPLSIAMLDLDNFKQINDNFSHQIGDQVLFAVGELVQNCTRSRDIAARYGGEEFVLALSETTLQHAQVLCERLRKNIEFFDWQQIHPDLKVTASIGISSDTRVENYEKLLDLADAQMYRAKRSGKNRVCTEESILLCSDLILED